MKYIVILSLLALAACSEQEASTPSPITRSYVEPDTTSGMTIQVDTAWDGETTVNF
jgi:hypothetical protein